MSTQDLILVAGATGKIGSSIARQLERLGKEFRLLVRDPKKLSGFPSAEKVTGEYGDVESSTMHFEACHRHSSFPVTLSPANAQNCIATHSRLHSEPAFDTSYISPRWEPHRTLVSRCPAIIMKARDSSKTPGYRMRFCRTAFTPSSPCRCSMETA